MVNSNSLYEWPQIDLHVHLDGSIEPVTLMKLAAEQGLSASSKQANDHLSCMLVGNDCTSLVEYAAELDYILPSLQTKEALEQVAYEVVQHAAEQQIKYMEVRFAPQLRNHSSLKVSEMIQFVIQGLRRGVKEFGVQARVIAICMGNHPPKANLETVDSASTCIGENLATVELTGNKFTYSAAASLMEITQLILNGIDASLLQAQEKAALKKDFEEVLARLEVYKDT
jgi:adenosine deaminase